jgi:hypothetical protein
MLVQSMCQLTSPFSLNLKFANFYMRIFLIKGCSKLHHVDFDEFSLLSLPTNIILRFCQSISRNWRIDTIQCFVDQHQHVVDCPCFMWLKFIRSLLIDIWLFGQLINQGHILWFYALSLSGRFLMKYSLCLLPLVVIDFISLWTSWPLISLIYAKKSCQT